MSAQRGDISRSVSFEIPEWNGKLVYYVNITVTKNIVTRYIELTAFHTIPKVHDTFDRRINIHFTKF